MCKDPLLISPSLQSPSIAVLILPLEELPVPYLPLEVLPILPLLEAAFFSFHLKKRFPSVLDYQEALPLPLKTQDALLNSPGKFIPAVFT